MYAYLIILGFLIVGVGVAFSLKPIETIKLIETRCPFHGTTEGSAIAVINNPKDGDYFVVKTSTRP